MRRAAAPEIKGGNYPATVQVGVGTVGIIRRRASGMPGVHVDVLIVGAGISGIGAGCHLVRECPDRTFAILESRDAMGGTWDLFRYPGIRSDSDMYTFGYG